MKHISVILLSWKRQKNIQTIINSLRENPRVQEIIVWNNNPDIELHCDHALVINSPKNYMPFVRYSLYSLATHSTVFFQDDDLLISAAQLEQLFTEYQKDPSRIYGMQGRNLVDDQYVPDAVVGECDIILGQLMLFHRGLLDSVIGKIYSLLPFTRGDDIAFSLLCQRKHYVVPMQPSINLGSDDCYALWRQPGHFERRQAMVDRIRLLQKNE